MRATLMLCCALFLVLGACGDDETSESPAPQDTSSDAAVTDQIEEPSDAVQGDSNRQIGDTTPEETTGDPDATEISLVDTTAADAGEDDDGSDTQTSSDATTDMAQDLSAADSVTDSALSDSGEETDLNDVEESDVEALPEWACTAEQPCTGANDICFGPEDDFCGMCMDPEWPCQDDGQCDEGTVCGEEAPPCSCTGETECVAACIPGAECALGKLCDEGGHCTAKPCGDNAECPANFSCTGGACARTSCSASKECDDHCVKGKCYGIPGNCSPPPP